MSFAEITNSSHHSNHSSNIEDNIVQFVQTVNNNCSVIEQLYKRLGTKNEKDSKQQMYLILFVAYLSCLEKTLLEILRN